MHAHGAMIDGNGITPPEAEMLATPIQSDATAVYAFDARGVANFSNRPQRLLVGDAKK